MKLKAQEIYNMYDAIMQLSQEKTAMPTAYYIAKNTRIIKEEASQIDEARQKLINEYGEKKADGTLNTQENGMIKIEDAGLIAFQEQLGKLMNAEIDVAIRKIPLSSLNNINISINTIETLLPIIEDDETLNEDAPENVEITVDENGNMLGIQ